MFARKLDAKPEYPISDALDRASKILGTYHSVSNESSQSYGFLAMAELIEVLAKRVIELERTREKTNIPTVTIYHGDFGNYPLPSDFPGEQSSQGRSYIEFLENESEKGRLERIPSFTVWKAAQ